MAPIDGMDRLGKALANVEKLFIPYASVAMTNILKILKGKEIYPEQPDRMRSGRLNRYVRGQGIYPKNAFIPDAKQPGGFSLAKGSKAVKLTSQQMDKKYQMDVEAGNPTKGLLINDATYSGWVIGPKKGEPHQVSFHATTGWPNEDDLVESAMGEIKQEAESIVSEFLHDLVGS
jgi:hypothetical protein